MNNLAIIGLSILLCFIAFSIVARNYITPGLQAWSREDAIKALAAPHMFRFVGSLFLVSVSKLLESAESFGFKGCGLIRPGGGRCGRLRTERNTIVIT